MLEWLGWGGAIVALLFVSGIVFYGPGLRATSAQIKATPPHAVAAPALRVASPRRS